MSSASVDSGFQTIFRSPPKVISNQWKKPYLLFSWKPSIKWFLESSAFEEPTIGLYRRFTFSCVFKYKCCFRDLETSRIWFFLSLLCETRTEDKNNELLQQFQTIIWILLTLNFLFWGCGTFPWKSPVILSACFQNLGDTNHHKFDPTLDQFQSVGC